ncbi:MAG: ArnT family glycosyltransferase [Candidatus Dojkabacteria bacterium]
MKKSLLVIGLLALFILTLILNGSPFIFGDGYGYFHNAKTLTTTGTFLQTNKPEYFPYTGHAVTEESGKFVTVYPPGSSLLMWPFLSISKLISSGTVYSDYYKAFDGHSLADGVAVLLAASFYMILAVLIIYKLLRGLGFSTKITLVSLTAVYLGSYIITYTEQFASYSHIYEIFAVSLLLYCLYLFGRRFEYRYMLFAGLATGLLVLTRPIDAVIVLPIFIFIAIYRNRKALTYYLLGGAPFAFLFLAFNYTSYGNALSTGYGSTEKLFDFSKFNLGNLLFSDVRGWFFYSPIMILASIGLILYARKNKPSFLIYLAPCILLIALYSFWPNWWGGDSLGQRFLMVLVPFMAIGLANLLKMIRDFRFASLYKPLILFVIVICTFYSLIVTALYRVTPTAILYAENLDTAARYPEVTPAERFTPIDILSYHLSAIMIDGFGTQRYWNDIQKGFNGGRSLALLAAGLTDPLARIERVSDREFILHLIPNNAGKSMLTNITVGIVQKDKYTTFNIANANFTKASEIKFNCIEDINCSADWKGTDAGTGYEREILPKKTTDLKEVNYSSDLKVDFKADQTVNFVDYKLKY